MTVRGFTLRQNPAYRPGGSRPSWLLATFALLAASGGCRTAVPRQPIVPAESPAPAPAVALPSRWIVSRDLLAREYVIEQSASLQITTDSGTVSDSTGLSLATSVRSTADGGVAGLIRSATLHTLSGSSAIPGVTLPVAFTGGAPARGAQHQLIARAVPTDPCQGSAQALLGTIRDLTVVMPDTLTIGRTWSDSGSLPTCRGGARLVVSTTRTFRVRAHEPRGEQGVLIVDRRSSSRILGSAIRGSDTTTVEGQGSASAELVLDARTGALVSLSGTGALDITVRGATRSERARQVLRTRVVQPGG